MDNQIIKNYDIILFFFRNRLQKKGRGSICRNLFCIYIPFNQSYEMEKNHCFREIYFMTFLTDFTFVFFFTFVFIWLHFCILRFKKIQEDWCDLARIWRSLHRMFYLFTDDVQLNFFAYIVQGGYYKKNVYNLFLYVCIIFSGDDIYFLLQKFCSSIRSASNKMLFGDEICMGPSINYIQSTVKSVRRKLYITANFIQMHQLYNFQIDSKLILKKFFTTICKKTFTILFLILF